MDPILDSNQPPKPQPLSLLTEDGLLNLEKYLLNIVEGLSPGDDLVAIQDIRRYIRNRLKEIVWQKYAKANAI